MFPVSTRNSKELIHLLFRAAVWSIPVIAYRKLFRNPVFAHRTISATNIIVRITETLFDCPDRIINHVVTLFCRRQIDQLHDIAVHHLMVVKTAERCADDTDSRVTNKIIGKELAIAQKILRIFIVDAIHNVLRNR